MSSDPQAQGGPTSLIARVVGGLFALIVAPLLVTIGSNLLQKKLVDDGDDAPKAVAAAPASTPAAGTSSKAEPKKPAEPAADPPKVAVMPEKPKEAGSSPKEAGSRLKETSSGPDETGFSSKDIGSNPSVTEKPAVTKLASRGLAKKSLALVHLFNGKDLTNFSTFLGPPSKGLAAYGKNNDPEKVFTVRNSQLHISGKVDGIVETEQDYENYHLTVEYRLGAMTSSDRSDGPKLSGILLHAKGAEGGGAGQWRVGFRVMIAEDAVGNIVLPAVADRSLSLTAEAEKTVALKGVKAGRLKYHYRPGASSVTLTKGTIERLHFAKGPALKKDVGTEITPKDGWNTVECICAGDRLSVLLNGKVVNVATKLSVSKGKVGIISDGAEVFVRTIDLKPLARGAL